MVMMRYIGILITLLTSYFAWSQKPYVEIKVEPRRVEVGEQFTVIVKSNVSGDIEINLPKEFEQGYNILNRMEQEYDGNTGELVTYFFHGRTGTLSKAGKYTFGPAMIKANGHVYRSNKVNVRATEESDTADKGFGVGFSKPAFGIIEASKTKVYAGEAFTVQCKVVSKFKPTHYDSYRPFNFDPAADQHKLGANTQPMVDMGTFRGERRYMFDHDKQVVFLNSPGKVLIHPFSLTLQVSYQGYEVRSKRNHIKVLPLPKGAPKTFTGGVGQFKIKSSCENKTVKQGDVIVFTVILSGNGNLHDMNRPKINFGDHFQIYGDPEIKEKFSYTSRGAEGETHIIYHLQAMKAGQAKFNPIQLSYFDPAAEEYKTVSDQPANIEIETNPDFVVEKKDQPTAKEARIDRFNSDSKDSEGGFLSSKTAKWIGIGISTPLCLALLFLFFRKRKEDEQKVIAKQTETAVEAQAPKIPSTEFLSVLQAHANNGNELPFFTQLSSDLRKASSQAAKNDPDWVLSNDDLKSFFTQKGYSQEFQNDFFSLQQTCELCRYGCQKPEADLNIYLTKAKTIFETLEA